MHCILLKRDLLLAEMSSYVVYVTVGHFSNFLHVSANVILYNSLSRSQLRDNDYLLLKSAIEVLMIRDGVLTIPNQLWSRVDLKECLSIVSSASRVNI